MSARYFTKKGEGVQSVLGLKDPQVYFDLGYEEVDEAAYNAYLASLPKPEDLLTAFGPTVAPDQVQVAD